jgi:hypothetical protein
MPQFITVSDMRGSHTAPPKGAPQAPGPGPAGFPRMASYTTSIPTTMKVRLCFPAGKRNTWQSARDRSGNPADPPQGVEELKRIARFPP